MGAKHSLEDDLITFKLTSKQMARAALKCDKNAKVQKQKLVKAMKDQNTEGAKIYAQNVIREQNQSLTFLRLGSRIDAVAARLETAIKMQAINTAMGQTVKGMANAMKSMETSQITKVMDQFEKSFEDMDVKSTAMERTMESSTSMSTPPDQVDQLIQMVADEAGLEIAGLFDGAGVASKPISSLASQQNQNKANTDKEVDELDELEKRIGALKK